MLPFNEALRLWRLERGLTQAALAQRARVPRPNLSAIERGRREVSLATLRSLALGLDVRPGVLADGIAPGAGAQHAWSRAAMERIAEAVVRGTTARQPAEQAVAELLRRVISHPNPASSRGRGSRRHDARASATAWVLLQSRCAPGELRSLLQRIDDRRRR
ncbi:MAG: helix-turn-helix transcriptional regulator [Candidatus Omnitrophica bacterium]|nr:helix-turn-helix transcriptional regulator [Candidatus Omnitrophota bacterium]MBI3021648.1 helix-turn-helix transcriptional regulator [Candidatus Omnitrophota bacterium]MBI3083368.1 helix-turn-helix transcriptional regulator [Candidatus Omnitrophota bacterium]